SGRVDPAELDLVTRVVLDHRRAQGRRRVDGRPVERGDHVSCAEAGLGGGTAAHHAGEGRTRGARARATEPAVTAAQSSRRPLAATGADLRPEKGGGTDVDDR